MNALSGLGADELWAAVLSAAEGSRTGAAGTVARLCESAGSPRLGWVSPPRLSTIARGVAAIRAQLTAPVVFLATGGWCFAAQALCETAGSRGRLVPLDSLDLAAIQRAIPGDGGYLAVSSAGSTLETRCLAEAVGDRVVWLRDVALSPRRVRDQVALLGAPLSMAFLTAADIVDGDGLAAAYRGLVGRYRQIGADAVQQATTVAVTEPVRLHFIVPGWAGPGLRRWLLQLGRQVLCGKSHHFRPSVYVTDRPERSDATLDFGAARRELPALLEMFYRASVFVACLGLRAGIEVAEHAHVRAYKDRVAQADPDDVPGEPVPVPELPKVVADWLASRPDLDWLHVVAYWSREIGPQLPEADEFARLTGRPCEVHEGSAWNHHSFQAVYADPTTAVLLITRSTEDSRMAARTLRRIAVATHQALADRSLLVQGGA